MPLRSYIAMQKGKGEKTVSYWQSNEIKRLYDVLVLQLIENRKWCQEVKRSGRFKIQDISKGSSTRGKIRL